MAEAAVKEKREDNASIINGDKAEESKRDDSASAHEGNKPPSERSSASNKNPSKSGRHSSRSSSKSSTTASIDIMMDMVNKMSSSIADLAGEVQSLTKRQDKSERETREAMKRAPPPHHGDERHANAKRSRVTVIPSDEEYGPYGGEESDDTNPDEDCAADSDCELIDQIDALLKPPNSKETESDANAQDGGWLAEIAQDFALDEQKSPAITQQLADILNGILSKTITDEKIKPKLDAYPPPNNVQGLCTPKVNSEIWGKIKTETRSRDIRFQKAQVRLARGLTPLAQLAEKILLAQRNQSQLNLQDALKLALNAFALIANGHMEISHRRREMIRPDLNAGYRELCSQNTPITDNLFGNELAKQVKEINDTNRVATRVTGYGYNYPKGSSRYAGKGKVGYGGFRGRREFKAPKNGVAHYRKSPYKRGGGHPPRK